MIEILHIINSLEIGGAQKLLVDILPLMNNEKMKVSLLVLKSVDSSFCTRIKNSGIEVFSLNSRSYHNPFIILRLIPFLRKFSIVHVHLFPSLYWVALANIFVSTKLIFTEHSTNNRRRGKVGFSFIIPFKSIFVLLMIASFHRFGISRIGGLYGRQKSSRCNCRGCDGIYVA